MNLYDLVIKQYNQILDHYDLDEDIREYITCPKNEIMVNYPIRLDNGKVKVLKAYRVQHNNVLGPFKGGIRFSEDIYLDEVKSLDKRALSISIFSLSSVGSNNLCCVFLSTKLSPFTLSLSQKG